MLGQLPILALVLLLVGGCAQRTLEIASDPPGAIVYLNGQEVGRTPMKYDFKWYGDYDVALRKEGYETLKTHRKISVPWYGVPPIDLGAELVGAKDVRQWEFKMTPAKELAGDEQALVNRGEALREDLQSGRYTRMPSGPPTTRPATRPLTQP